jgi:hypothetical protein
MQTTKDFKLFVFWFIVNLADGKPFEERFQNIDNKYNYTVP